MRILIVGGTQFLGRRVPELLHERGDEAGMTDVSGGGGPLAHIH